MGQLILTRRADESVIIGDNITVTVLGVKGKQVRLAFDCPKHIDVHRSEIFERINGVGSLPEVDTNLAHELGRLDDKEVAA